MTTTLTGTPAAAASAPPPAPHQPQTALDRARAHPIKPQNPLKPGPAPRTPPQPAELKPLSNGEGPTPQQEAAIQAAATRARATGKPVTVDALTTETERIVANPQGGLTLDANPKPVRTRQRSKWVPIDTTLHRNDDGTLTPDATAYGTVRFSGGGTGPLLVTSSGTTSYSLSWPARLPAPKVNGSTATYSSVLTGVDLVVSATDTGGFHETLVVHDAAAAANPALASLTLPSKVTNGHLDAGAAEDSLSITGSSGAVLETSSAAMWDSSTGAATRPRASSRAKAPAIPDESTASRPGAAARVGLIGVHDDGRALHLVPDKTMMADRTRLTYPLYLDPTAHWHDAGPPAAPAFDEVKQGSPCNHVSLYNNTGDAGDHGYLAVGMQRWESGCAGIMRTYYQWKLPSVIWDSHINLATVNATEMYSATCGSTADAVVNLHWSGAIRSSTDWNNKPAYAGSFNQGITFGESYNPTYCPKNGTVSKGYTVTSLINQAAGGHWPQLTVALAEDAAEKNHDRNGFKRFTDNPTLAIQYNRKPATPTAARLAGVTGSHNVGCATTTPYPYMGKTITTNTPVLSSRISDPDGDSLQASFKYWVDGSSTSTTALSGDNMASNSTAKFSLPSSFVSGLTNGKTVDWQVRVFDGIDYSGWSPICHFTAEPKAPDPPAVVSVGNSYPDLDQNGGTGARTGTAGSFNLTSTGTAATKFAYNLDVQPSTTNPPASQTVTATNNTATVSVTPRSPGPHTLWAFAIDAAGDVSGTVAYRFVADGDPNVSCASLAACFNNTAITADTNMGGGFADGTGHTLSATDLNKAGWASGGEVTVDGAPLPLPAFGAGQKDNVVAADQTVAYTYPVPAKGLSALEFLATSTDAGFADPGPIDHDVTAPYVRAGAAVTGTYCFAGDNALAYCPAQGTITYTDGTIRPYYLTVPDWISGPPDLAAVALTHWNLASGQITDATKQPKLYPFSVPLLAGKTVQSVTLPDIGNLNAGPGGRLHIFSMGARNTTTGTTLADGTVAAAAAGQTWTGTWAMPLSTTSGGGDHFTNMTIRTEVFPNVSGSSVRIKLDNPLSTGAVVLSHVTMGGAGEGAALESAPANLTFNGKPGVTVPVGGMVYSDPMTPSFDVSEGISVSMAVTSAPAYLSTTRETPWGNGVTFISAPNSGDHASDQSASAFTGSGEDYFAVLLSNVDVLTDGVPTQVSYGNGIVDSTEINARVPYEHMDAGIELARIGMAAQPEFSALSEGVQDEYLTVDNPRGTVQASAMSRVDRDLLDLPNVDTIYVDEGLEDVLNRVTNTADGVTLDTGATVESAYGKLLDYLQTSEYNQVATNLVAIGLQPCDGYPGGGTTKDPCTAAVDADRTSVNGWIRSDPYPGMFYIDPDAVLGTLNAADDEIAIKPGLQYGDHVNFSDEGPAALIGAYEGPHNTWRMDDGDDNPDAIALSDTASDAANPVLSADPTVGTSPAFLNGPAQWVTDPDHGEVLNFATTGGAVADQPPIDTSKTFAFGVWVKLTDNSKDQTVLEQDGSTGTVYRLSYDHTTNTWQFYLASRTSATTVPAKVTPQSPVGKWTFLFVDSEPEGGPLLTVYGTDGIDMGDGSTPSWDPFNPPAADGPLEIGTSSDGSNFTGTISDLNMYAYELPPDLEGALADEYPR